MDKKIKELMFSKKSIHWATPKDFYEKLNREFNFNFDPCPLNSSQNNAMFIDWKDRVFINPPYNNIRNFLEKGIIELKKGHADILVYLVPARTDTKWFHDLVYKKATEIRFIKGRLRFNDGDPLARAPFPSMLCIYRRRLFMREDLKTEWNIIKRDYHDGAVDFDVIEEFVENLVNHIKK